jgi:phosphoglycerate kinase
MSYELRKIQDVDIKGKTIFLRADLDVPISNGKIADDSRLNAFLPTLEYLLEKGAKVIIAGHLGRPEGKDEKFSLKPVAHWICKKQNWTPKDGNIGSFEGATLSENVSILENLRFYKEEEENNPEFSQKLADLAQIYVNDAFASSHRAHASIVGITKFLPSFAGLRLIKEVEELSSVLNNPKRPLTIIIGGAKIETKLPLVEKMHHFADYVLVGGEIAENDKVLLKVAHEKIQGQKAALIVADLIENTKDITQKSAENFVQIAEQSNTIIWNGPMGLVEEEEYAVGTKILAEEISKLTAYKIVGGGDTLSYLKKINLLSKFNFASTGGGAMLEFLSGEKLPGLVALEKQIFD